MEQARAHCGPFRDMQGLGQFLGISSPCWAPALLLDQGRKRVMCRALPQTHWHWWCSFEAWEARAWRALSWLRVFSCPLPWDMAPRAHSLHSLWQTPLPPAAHTGAVPAGPHPWQRTHPSCVPARSHTHVCTRGAPPAPRVPICTLSAVRLPASTCQPKATGWSSSSSSSFAASTCRLPTAASEAAKSTAGKAEPSPQLGEQPVPPGWLPQSPECFQGEPGCEEGAQKGLSRQRRGPAQ